MKVESLSLRTVYNSRVEKTVEAEVNGEVAAAPSGASTGSHEALCFVPENLEGVEQDLKEKVEGRDLDQQGFDSALEELDGTGNFSDIGAAAIASSLAFKKASGFESTGKYPFPAGNLLGGGEHGGNTSIQEFLVLPLNAGTVPEAMEILSNVYHEFQDRYSRRIKGINDEGAYITSFDDEESLKAVKKVADEHGASVGVDVAASEFYEDGEYRYESLGQRLDPGQQVKFVEKITEEYDLVYVEDPFDEEDFDALAEFTGRISDALVVGDDVFVTQRERLQRGMELDAGNSIIIKPNQAGTVSRTRRTVEKAQEEGYLPVVSHRSGETCDPAIADLALELGAPLMKAGIADIRTAKNNQLLRRWDREGGDMAEVKVLNH
ncbi:MAG: enolase C-terminal domain-like protein [Candidatus Nanohaloarchaea archaeon]|nr:enolase C-terminal domain-like protein [Candidatus Nanohaloarchaea archaeon]